MSEITINSSMTECEEVISTGKRTFLEVGNALAVIMEGQKYRERGFGSFAEYCETKWGFKKTYAYQLVNSAAAVKCLDSAIAETITESQARELAKVPVEQRVEVLAKAGPTPTAKSIKQAAIIVSAKPAHHTEVVASAEPVTATGTAPNKDDEFLKAMGLPCCAQAEQELRDYQTYLTKVAAHINDPDMDGRDYLQLSDQLFVIAKELARIGKSKCALCAV